MQTSIEALQQGALEVCQSVPCVCCGQRLGDDDAYCHRCETPSALSVATTRGQPQRFISVLGASNAGKTVYLGLLLDILSKGIGSLQGSPRSMYSLNLQEQVITALEQRRFPAKTPSESDAWNWVHCDLSVQQRRAQCQLELIAPDLAGEAIALELQHAGSYPIIQHVVSRSAGLMILCDSMRVRDEGSSEDLFATKLASFVATGHGLAGGDRRGRTTTFAPRVAIVFTKCDGCPEAMDDPGEFAANNLPRLFEFNRRKLPHHHYFAASVAGHSVLCHDLGNGPQRVPLHIEPRGIVEPLCWLVDQGKL